MANQSSWVDGALIGFDTETTGVDTETARIVTATVIVVEPGRPPVTHSWLVDPGVEIPVEASDVHGVTTEHARAHGRAPVDALTEISALLDRWWTPLGPPLVAYNAAYDLTLFDRERVRHGLGALDMTDRRVVDPLVIDRAVDRYRKGGRKLTQVCEHYRVELGDAAHSSDADTLATLRVAYRIAKRYPREVGSVALDALHAVQARWHAAWCRNMSQFLDGEAGRLERAATALSAGSDSTLAAQVAERARRFAQEKFDRLDIAEEVTAESVARVAAETRARAGDILAQVEHWPMRMATVV